CHLNRCRGPRKDVPTVIQQDQVSSLLYVIIHINSVSLSPIKDALKTVPCVGSGSRENATARVPSKAETPEVNRNTSPGAITLNQTVPNAEPNTSFSHAQSWSASNSTRTNGTYSIPGDKRFVCSYCSKRFRCVSQLTIHQRSHTGEKPYRCTLCGKRYLQKGHLYTHQRTHTGEKPYRCSLCAKGFIQQCTLDMHLRSHTGEKPYTCTECGKGFMTKFYLNKHLSCQTCNNSERQPTIGSVFGKEWCMNLWRHEESHVGQKDDSSDDFITYTVPSDDQDQSNVHQTPAEEQALDGTISTHGDVTTGPDLSPDVEFIPNNLNFIESVTPNKNFKCVFCGKSFEYLSHMTRHMRKHSGEKPYICTVCGKRFAQKTYLTTHQRTHSGERPYSCMECGKTHMRTHSGEKPFVCTVCGKRFAQKTYLRIHQRTHSGERPYSCMECGKSFAQKSSLNVHLRSHTGEKPYSCSECGKSYAYKQGFNTHQCFG
uniref:C2H2-type domain-containing protein n=1 Tax=Cyprinus carpio carpio TaxID=630221 RepID=A0A8C1E406_CYPCA